MGNTVSPVTFICNAKLSLPPETIAAQILDVTLWPTFSGYGPLPGVKVAEIVTSPPHGVGTRFQVVNTDGSRHMEEIIEWQPDRRLALKMSGFTPPLSFMATHFVETWEFQRHDNLTTVQRTFAMYPRSFFTRPFLITIAIWLRRAIVYHLCMMESAAS